MLYTRIAIEKCYFMHLASMTLPGLKRTDVFSKEVIMTIIINLIIGAIAGSIAGNIMGIDGSLIKNIALGLVGGVVGSAVMGLMGMSSTGFISGIFVSCFGACLLIWLVRKIVS